MTHPVLPTNSTALTWLEVNRKALLGNLQAFRRRIGPAVELVHVIKSNAYGHGLELVGQAVESANAADRFAVISVEELLRLRKAGITKPIMVLGYVAMGDLPELVSAKGIPVLSSESSLVALSSAAKDLSVSVKVHLKVETGTHRYGFDGKELESVLNRIPNLPGIELEGLATHFANIEDTTDHSFAEGQLQTYVDLLAHARSLGLEVPVPNAACSAAAILFPKANFGLVRVGIASYGIWPSKQTKVSAQHVSGADLSLRPVLSWKTTVAQVKDVPAGGYVGYGCSWRASAPTKLAVLPVGYADGYDRELSNQAHVLIRGQRAPVRGRVCMNVAMVDVTHIPQVAQEDPVTLLGTDGDETVSAEHLAEWCGTIPYEILARIAPHLPRVLI